MRHDFIDRYSRIESPVHRRPAGVKLSLALALLVTVILLPAGQPLWLALPAVLLAGVAAASRVPLPFLVTRLLMLEPFVLGVALLSLLQPGGLRVFGLLLARGTLCLLAVILLANTTPFSEILRVLRRVRLPPLLVTTLALMYRYVFVLVDETERLGRARACRTFRRDRGHLWRSAAGVIGEVFVRSTERAERIYAAMCARGWKA